MYKQIWENNINVNPDNIEDIYDYTKAIQRIRNEKFVRIGEYSVLKFELASAGVCDITLLEKTFHFTSLAFTTHKSFLYTEHFNER